MTVIELKRAKKHLVEVVFDGESVLIDSETVLLEGVRPGSEFNEVQLETLKYKSDFTRAKSKALWLLSRREYSKKELIGKLKPDFPIECATEAVELLEQSGVVDDRRFAEMYAYDLSNYKKMASGGIKYELIRKGIEREAAEEIAEEYAQGNCENITEIIKLKYSGFSVDEKIKRRMYSALLRKGYSYSEINSAVNDYEENI